jgi:CDP-diacylglycerol--glycerol-3-phosphate 3-phosphatidyltransferase
MSLHSLYTTEEARILKPWQKIRQKILHPVTKLLILLKLTPNRLSYLSVISGAIFCLLANQYFSIAFWFLVISVICDGLDGVLARELGVDSPQGSFTDAICDQTVLALSVIAMMLRGAVNPILGVLFVYTYTTFIMFIILHNVLGVSSKSIFRPGRNVFFIGIGIYFLFGVNILNHLLIASLFTIPLLYVSFKRLQSAI